MTIRYNKSKTKGDKKHETENLQRRWKSSGNKGGPRRKQTTLFSGLSDGGSAVIDVSSAVSFDFDNPISPIEAAYAAVPKTPEELEALYLPSKNNKPTK